jgi:uncharacterized protein YndB with AHSA1/START domain
MGSMTEVAVSRTVELDASPSEVWDSITDRTRLGEWLGGPVEIDVRPGGLGRVLLPGGERSVLVTEVDEGRRLAWVWSDEAGQLSTVELTLAGQGPATALTVIERSVVTASAKASLVGV